MENQAVMTKKPMDYLKIFFRRKWFIIIPAVLGIMGGIIASNMLPKVYQASTLILVEEERIINPLVKGLAVSTSTAQRLTTLRQQMLGWDRMIQLMSALNLAKDVKTQLQFENLVKELRRNIIVRLQGSNIINIAYRGEKPQEAQNIVKTITDIFIAENLRQQNKEAEDAIVFINDQLALYQKKIKQSEIARMEDQLNKLLSDSTEKHPLVIELRKKITQAKRELGEGNYNLNPSAIASSEDELDKLRVDLKQMREDIATADIDAEDGGINRTKLASATNEKLYKLLLLERMDDVGARDAGINSRLYDKLLERLETAKITQRLEASKQGTQYIILDPARLPLKPIKPNKPLVMFMGAFLGLCAGTGLVFGVEVFDHSFLGVDEAKIFLDLPVLGAISKIVTQADLKAQRLNRAKITSASVITGVVLLILIIFNVFLGN